MVDPTLQAALEAEAPFLFGAVKIEFYLYNLSLLDGSGALTIGGDTYLGEDPLFGSIDSIDALEETIGDEAPEIRLTLNPPDATAAATLAHSGQQGARVTIMMGAYDPATMSTIGTPEVLFLGEIDVPALEIGQGTRTVTYTNTSVFELMFEVNEGERASDGWLQSIFPGALGLQYMTGTARNLYWGAKRPVGAQIGNSVPSWMAEAVRRGQNL
jgi:hypothetical protein